MGRASHISLKRIENKLQSSGFFWKNKKFWKNEKMRSYFPISTITGMKIVIENVHRTKALNPLNLWYKTTIITPFKVLMSSSWSFQKIQLITIYIFNCLRSLFFINFNRFATILNWVVQIRRLMKGSSEGRKTLSPLVWFLGMLMAGRPCHAFTKIISISKII